MGECFFWYRLTQVVLDKGPLNVCVCVCMCIAIWYCSKTCCVGMGMCCEKMMMIGWRNAWSMKLRVQGQEEDQRGPGEMLSERTVKHIVLNKEDAMDRSKWRKMIKDVRWSGWVWVDECFFWYRPTRVVPDKRPLNGCVCVCVFVLRLVGYSYGLICTYCTHGLGHFRSCSHTNCNNLYNLLPLSGCLFHFTIFSQNYCSEIVG